MYSDNYFSLPCWVIAGHSLGGALACRLIGPDCPQIAAVALVGTTHPNRNDLSAIKIPVTKIYGTQDGIALPDRIVANKHLLPPDTRWVEIEGGNHSQFANYGYQLLDGTPGITRDEQQRITRAAIQDLLD